VLAHEMVHLQQYRFGDPSSRGYHNKQWSTMMKAIGLQPSSTGAVGGKETGQRMSHYVLPDAAFAQSFKRLAATGWQLNLQSAPHAVGSKKKVESKTKFTCGDCGQNAWGKPDLAIACEHCGQHMHPAKHADVSYDTNELPRQQAA
jgi:hypothetical protein